MPFSTPKERTIGATPMNAAGYSPISPLFRVCDGVRIRFADNKADSSAATVLMLSPWPESLWAFRRIWDRVSGAARVVAIDLPGFGHSDGRARSEEHTSELQSLAYLVCR